MAVGDYKDRGGGGVWGGAMVVGDYKDRGGLVVSDYGQLQQVTTRIGGGK